MEGLIPKIRKSYYLTTDVVGLARDLIGKEIHTNINGSHCAGIITETEAYAGENDRASHAYGGKRTNRTMTMFDEGGISYVYLCYGIHHLFNVVSGPKGMPHAVLIRGIKPLLGIDIMEQRRDMKYNQGNFSNGPGMLTKALGINKTHNNLKLTSDTLWMHDSGRKADNSEIHIGPRIGVDYAGSDALLPYRFLWQLK